MNNEPDIFIPLFAAVDRCLSFMYAFGTYEGFYSTQIHVFMEGTGMHRSKIRTYYGSTSYAWLPATLSIKAVENLKVIKCTCTIIILTFIRINHSYFLLYGLSGKTTPLHPLRIRWFNPPPTSKQYLTIVL